MLGAGYGGLRTALEVDRRLRASHCAEIILVDQYDYHHLITKLHEVMAASIQPQAARIPLARILRGKAIKFLKARVQGFRFGDQQVITSVGDVPYDYLVIALGSETDFFGVLGAEKYSLTLKSLDDALRIRAHIERMFKVAGSESRADRRKAMLTLVVSGGGFTGIEVAGELSDWLPELARDHNVDVSEVQLLVVEAGPSIMAGFPPRLVAQAQRILTRKRVGIKVSDPIIRVDDGSVELGSGERIAAGTVIWAGGVRTTDVVAKSGLQTGVRGRIVVNPFLETAAYTGVYVVGDAALILDPKTGRPLAPSAQWAVQQASCAARNICADVKGRMRVRYIPKALGEVVSLGRTQGLASLAGIEFDGRLAIILKEMTVLRYLYMVGGVSLLWEYLEQTSDSLTWFRKLMSLKVG